MIVFNVLMLIKVQALQNRNLVFLLVCVHCQRLELIYLRFMNCA